MSVLTKEDVEKLLKSVEGGEIIEKEVTLSWDGSNLLLRLPKEIADYLGVNKENRFKKNIKFKIEERNGDLEKSFELVDRTTPKRITK